MTELVRLVGLWLLSMTGAYLVLQLVAMVLARWLIDRGEQ